MEFDANRKFVAANFADGRFYLASEGNNKKLVAEYQHKDHLGNVRVAFSDRNGDKRLQLLDGEAGPSEVTQINDYFPFGLQFPKACGAVVVPENRYQYNGKEWEEEFGLYDYGARYYDPAIGRWGAVDPLADERYWVSPYNYVQNNPLNRIDPTGAIDNPIYGSDGTYRGNTTEGFTGEVIIYDGVEDFTNMTSDQLLNTKNMTTVDVGEPTLLGKASISAEAASKILTHVALQTEDVNFDRLEGGIINVVDSPIDEYGNMGHANGDSYGNWTNLPMNAEAGTMTNSDGSINVTIRLLGGRSQMSSVEYIQSVLGIHEYKGHGLNNVPQAFPAHKQAYKLQYYHKATFNKLTSYQQNNIKTTAGIK